jgi:hypothetical protein
MQDLILKQMKYETDTCKRSLGFMIDENIHLKNRLSEILRNAFNSNLLEQVEYFQNRFIKEDERIGLIRNDVAQVDKLLVKEAFEDGTILTDLNGKIHNICSNIMHAEKQFSELKLEFNNYLLEMLSTRD